MVCRVGHPHNYVSRWDNARVNVCQSCGYHRKYNLKVGIYNHYLSLHTINTENVISFINKWALRQYEASQSEKKREGLFVGLNNFALFDNQARMLYRSYGAACLAPIFNNIRKKAFDSSKVVYLWDNCFLKGNTKLTEKELEFFDWLVNRSVWSRAFLTKDFSNIVKTGMIYDATVDVRLLSQAIVGIRYSFEQRDIVYFWDLWNRSLDSHLSLLLAMLLTNDYGTGNWSIKPFFSNHLMFSMIGINWNSFKRMINNRPKTDEKKTIQKGSYIWSPQAGLWDAEIIKQNFNAPILDSIRFPLPKPTINTEMWKEADLIAFFKDKCKEEGNSNG